MVALMLALAAALVSLSVVFTTASWWLPAMVFAVLTTVAIGVMRPRTRFTWLPTLAGILALLVLATFSFAPSVAYLRFIPNFDVFVRFNRLAELGGESIAGQAIPAEPTEGILFILVVGAGLLAVVLDLIAIVAARPALTGIPLLALLITPTIMDPSLGTPFYFLLTAIAYLIVLYVGLGEVRTGGAVAVGAAALAAALIVPVLLPPPTAPEIDTGGTGGFAVGINAFITLGDNLRRDQVRRVMTYRTDTGGDEYLTVSVIRDFNGPQWGPSAPTRRDNAALDQFGEIPGLSDTAVKTNVVTTNITITNMGGHWLPAPYAPRTVSGADSDWTYDPENLTINSPSEDARGEKYTVVSATPTPTQEQLRAADPDAARLLGDYLQLPNGLSQDVVDTAAQVVGDADTNFDKALALQEYFTGGDFEYSEIAPVEDNYDGSSGRVIGTFLEKKSGYCVHFSSAMAVMARSLGIPARIAVGFTPGEFIEGKDGKPGYFAVTTQNLHAWPELWFDGIGWVRFEPTPGRGELPSFPKEADVDNPGSTPTPTATARPRDNDGPTPTPTSSGSSSATPGSVEATEGSVAFARVTVGVVIGLALLVLLVPLWPIVLRSVRRGVRFSRVRRRGSPIDAWAELTDTAVDLGWDVGAATPRQFADSVRARVNDTGVAAIDRLQAAVEAEAYSRGSGRAVLDDVGDARRAMQAASERREQLRAVFAPASAMWRR
jgi:hypothetical protein